MAAASGSAAMNSSGDASQLAGSSTHVRAERRIANDGLPYTFEEFQNYYQWDAQAKWRTAAFRWNVESEPEPPHKKSRVAHDDHDDLGKALAKEIHQFWDSGAEGGETAQRSEMWTSLPVQPCPVPKPKPPLAPPRPVQPCPVPKSMVNMPAAQLAGSIDTLISDARMANEVRQAASDSNLARKKEVTK